MSTTIIQLSVLILIVVILISLLIYLISSQNDIIDIIRSVNNDDLKEVNNQTLTMTDTNKIDIDIISADIKIIVSANKELKIIQKAAKELNDNESLEISQSNGIIKIKQKLKTKFFFFFSLSPSLRAIEIYLPQSYHKDISINNISGDLILEKSLSLNDLTINQTSGDLTIETVSVNDFIRDSVSGDLYIESLTCDDYSIESTSGDIEIGNISGKGNVKNISGNINLVYADIKSNTDIETVSGDVTLIIDSSLALDIFAKTVSGNITTNPSDNLKGTFGKQISTQIGKAEVYYPLNIKTVSGDISIAGK